MSTMSRRARVWHKVEVTADSAAREAIEYALMEAGALGTETIDDGDATLPIVRVIAYFDSLPAPNSVHASINEALRIYSLPASALYGSLSIGEVAGRDWLSEWKQSWQPVEVGRRFIVAPPWSEIGNTENRIVVRIEPGMAFGTGTHETTRLCLTAIEKYFDGASFLDAGTGTGILAIAAALINPAARIEACDTDAEAIEIARENARSNEVENRIGFRVGTIDETTRSADCVCANLTADVIVPLLPALVSATCERLILSGILTTQTEMVQARLTELGINNYELMIDGEWVALVV